MKRGKKEHSLSFLLGKYRIDKKQKKVNWINVIVLFVSFVLWITIGLVLWMLTLKLITYFNN